MDHSPRRLMNRWIGLATSAILLGLIAAAIGLQSGRVRSHIPYLNRPPPTATPAGVVLSLGQSALLPVNVATTPAVSAAATAEPTATAAPIIIRAATTGSASPTVSAAATTAPTRAPIATATTVTQTPSVVVAPQPIVIPPAVFLEPMTHWFQGWNQCAEVSSAMALSYFGSRVDPNSVTATLRPNKDWKASKNVESPYIVEYLRGQGVRAQAFEGGSVDRIKRLVAAGAPVIVGQWQNRTDHAGVGHWRVVRGYDDAKGIFLLNDSMVGAAVPMTYAEFDDLWPLYDYVYIPLWNDRLAPAIQQVMGAEMDPKVNAARAIAYDQSRIKEQPTNAELYFGLGGAYFKAGDDQKAVEMYHKAKSMGVLDRTPWALWDQSWPVTAMVNIGMDDEALQVAQENIKSAGVYALMRYERGRVFEKRGDLVGAKREYQMALVDNKNLKE
nr:C39 family peptidase [Chloroflexota bacterium]